MSMSNPFTPEHEAFRKTVKAWVEKELAPHSLALLRFGRDRRTAIEPPSREPGLVVAGKEKTDGR